jgi:nucleoporin NUP82
MTCWRICNLLGIALRTDPVIAASLSTDMFSASTMVVLTESMRTAFVSVSQNYASIVPGAGGSASTAGTGQVQPGLTVDSPGYVSLLGSTTYTPPRPLQTSYVQLASQIASPMTQKGQFTLTATTTRQLAETVDNFKRHMHEVQLAHRDVESRAALQRQELARQQETHSKLLALLKRQQERNDTSTRRLEAARGKQKDIFGKTDRILKAMLVRASPDLSENETRWFSELNRMRHEIMGADQYDERSLNSRADMVSRTDEVVLAVIESRS